MDTAQKELFYVDDDPDDRLFFDEIAASLGAKAVLFNSADMLLEALKKPPPLPSMIFMDLNMPKKNGYELLAEIRSQSAFDTVPILVLSTANALDSLDRCFQLGATLYLTKAARFHEMRELLEHILSIDWTQFSRNRSGFMYQHYLPKYE